jgi:hypothetical protein
METLIKILQRLKRLLKESFWQLTGKLQGLKPNEFPIGYGTTKVVP